MVQLLILIFQFVEKWSHHLISSNVWLFGHLLWADCPFTICSWMGIYILPKIGSHTSNACLLQAGLLLCILWWLPPQVKITLAQSLKTDFLSLLHTALLMSPLGDLLVSNFGGNFQDFSFWLVAYYWTNLEIQNSYCIILIHLHSWVNLDIYTMQYKQFDIILTLAIKFFGFPQFTLLYILLSF